MFRHEAAPTEGLENPLILRGDFCAAYSNWSSSSNERRQPRAPKFSSACVIDSEFIWSDKVGHSMRSTLSFVAQGQLCGLDGSSLKGCLEPLKK